MQILREKIAEFVLRKPKQRTGLRPGVEVPEFKLRRVYRSDSQRPRGLEGAASRGGGALKRMWVDAAKIGHSGSIG